MDFWAASPLWAAGFVIYLLPRDSQSFPGGFQFFIPLFENLLVFAIQFVGRGDIANGAVKPGLCCNA